MGEDTKLGRGSWMMFLCPIGWCHTHKQKAFYIDGTGKAVCNLTAELVRCSVEVQPEGIAHRAARSHADEARLPETQLIGARRR